MLNRIKLLIPIYCEHKLPPQQLKQVVKTITAELKKYLKAHPDTLNKLKPRQFKELITEILTSDGWEVVLSPSTKEREYDLYAVVHNADVDSSWIIECKKYSPENKVGIDIARAFYCVKQEVIAADTLLATTSNFAKRMSDFKASRYDLFIKDYKGILKWINKYYPHPDGKFYIKDNQLTFPEESLLSYLKRLKISPYG